MMKIGMIGFCNLNIMQYLYKYTNVLDAVGADYDVLYWNRLGIPEEKTFRGSCLSYDKELNSYQPFYKKIATFLGYMAFVRKTLKKNRYDKLIVLTTPTAMLLWDRLLGKYRNRYIFDFRDITKEHKLRPYKKLVGKLMDSAYVTMISSKGFLPVLEKADSEKIIMAHNTHRQTPAAPHGVRLSQEQPLRVAFWGVVRQSDHNKKLCDLFGNDSRFRLTFRGVGYVQELEDYCREKGYENIAFAGGYGLEEIEEFAVQTDILHCVYKNNRRTQPTLAVKLYDALEYRLPILVAEGSFLAQTLEGTTGSLAIGPGHTADMIYDWYRQLSAEQMERDYAAMEARVREDDRIFAETVTEFCR